SPRRGPVSTPFSVLRSLQTLRNLGYRTLGPSMGSYLKFMLGLSVSLVATLLASFGIALQRRSHLIMANPGGIGSTPLRRQLDRHRWGFGFAIYLAGSLIGSIFSIGSLPVTLLAPLGAFSLVCNVVVAKLMLGDPGSWQAGVGTLVILLGALLVGGFGSLNESDRSLDDLLILYGRPQFIAYFAAQDAMILIAMVWNAFNAHHIDSATRLGAYGHNKLPFRRLNLPTNRTVVGLVYGTISSLLATQGVLFAKSGLELLALTVGGADQFDRPLAWWVVGLLAVTALAQLYYLNRAVAMCDIVVLVPCNYGVYNVSCLINGLVYYDLWGELAWWRLLLVALGTLILTLGVVVLAFRPQAPSVVVCSPIGSDAEFAGFIAGATAPPAGIPPLEELSRPPTLRTAGQASTPRSCFAESPRPLRRPLSPSLSL
ncbi:hypothetical protein L0F63_002541, partial [Massospora cicadina]